MSISTPFIERPVATSLLMAGILLVGLVAFPLLPVAPLPQAFAGSTLLVACDDFPAEAFAGDDDVK